MSQPKPPPRVVIFAGPNGAGKSTHADAILAALGMETFVNADYIARGLSGRNTEAVAFEAGRIMLKRLRQLAEDKADFAFESTLSSRTFDCGCKTRKPTHCDGNFNMAQTAKTQPSRLTPSPKALQKALEQSAKQAQRLADAFGLVVPTLKSKTKDSDRRAA
jgi:predicted kinase